MSNSGQVLSREEVAALVEAMQSGEMGTSAETPASSSVQPYSLVANDTTSRSQLAALEMINDRFSRQLRGSLLTLLRQAVKVSSTPFDVMTFNAYLQSLPSPCNVNIVRFLPLRGFGLVTLEPTIVYGAVDSFFGGRGGASLELSPQRGFTPTEERIIQLLLESIFENLREAWVPVYPLNPEYVSREINPAFAQVGEDRETVAVSRFDLEIGPDVRGQLTVMYPFSALKPIRLLLRGRVQTGDRDEKLAARWADQLCDAVSDTELQLVVQLATLRISALDLATIKAGDTLWFKPPSNVKVLVQSAHLFDAEYGTADNSVAVRIDRIIEPPAAAHESEEASQSTSTEERGSDASAVGNKARRGSASSKRMAGVSAA